MGRSRVGYLWSIYVDREGVASARYEIIFIRSAYVAETMYSPHARKAPHPGKLQGRTPSVHIIKDQTVACSQPDTTVIMYGPIHFFLYPVASRFRSAHALTEAARARTAAPPSLFRIASDHRTNSIRCIVTDSSGEPATTLQLVLKFAVLNSHFYSRR